MLPDLSLESFEILLVRHRSFVSNGCGAGLVDLGIDVLILFHCSRYLYWLYELWFRRHLWTVRLILLITVLHSLDPHRSWFVWCLTGTTDFQCWFRVSVGWWGFFWLSHRGVVNGLAVRGEYNRMRDSVAQLSKICFVGLVIAVKGEMKMMIMSEVLLLRQCAHQRPPNGEQLQNKGNHFWRKPRTTRDFLEHTHCFIFTSISTRKDPTVHLPYIFVNRKRIASGWEDYLISHKTILHAWD